MNGLISKIGCVYNRHNHIGLFNGRKASFFSFGIFITFVSIMISIFIFDFIFNIGGK